MTLLIGLPFVPTDADNLPENPLGMGELEVGKVYRDLEGDPFTMLGRSTETGDIYVEDVVSGCRTGYYACNSDCYIFVEVEE